MSTLEFTCISNVKFSRWFLTLHFLFVLSSCSLFLYKGFLVLWVIFLPLLKVIFLLRESDFLFIFRSFCLNVFSLLEQNVFNFAFNLYFLRMLLSSIGIILTWISRWSIRVMCLANNEHQMFQLQAKKRYHTRML